MESIVDLHVHSHYSRATSSNCTIEGLYFWGKKKGINIIGTGDFTHPEWFAEFQKKLEPVEGGLFRLNERIAREIDKTLPKSVQQKVLFFVPTVEIASIYSKNGRVRKLHQLVVMPTFEAIEQFNRHLSGIANLRADGRPILGMDAKEVLRLSLMVDPRSLYIPAHIWTPWFGLFGSKSDFDSLEEAYEELTGEVRAIETGLSSDPPMNWRLKQLQGISITSHSDAHSPQKLGREATIINCDQTYEELIGAIKTNDDRLTGTIEFFPEEGKYFHDGHRLCGISLEPEETKHLDGICPKCSRPLVVGVDYRVSELADCPINQTTPTKRVEYIVPLTEVIAERRGLQTTSGKAVTDEYDKLIAALGSEFDIIRQFPIDSIRAYSPSIALAVERIRSGRVQRNAGYDGVYGTIKVFAKEDSEGQTSLF